MANNSIFMNNLMQEYARFQSNPEQYLLESGLKLQPGTLDNPQKAFEYLMQTKQVNQNQVNQCVTMMNIPH